MPTPLTYTFSPGTSEQVKSWVQGAISRARFPFNNASLAVNFQVVAEPPCPGHSDYMCTVTGGGPVQVYIREGADNPSASFNSAFGGNVAEVQRFFQESIIHEVVGHAFPFTHMVTADADKTRIAGMFRRNDSGDNRAGTLADWNPLDKDWADRIQEALAEFLKDVYMPEQFREYDNRTNWDFQRDRFDELVTWIEDTTCAGLA